MKIILTGATGFIGSCFLRKLNDLGIDDILIVDTAPRPDNPNIGRKKFKEYVTREELLKRVSSGKLEKVDAMYHLGACADTTEKDRDFLQKNNFEYSKSLAKWALANSVRFHYASSASVYGDGKQGYKDDDSEITKFKPLNLYAESKWQFDKWLIDEKLTGRVVGFRYFNVFGPNEYHKGDMRSMVCKSYEQTAARQKVKLFATSRPGFADGSEERDFIYVKDVDEVMAYFLEHPDKNGIFNVGTGRARSFKDLVLAMFEARAKKPEITFIPMPDKLKGQYQYFTEADLSKLRAAGYNKPFMRLEDSVRNYVQTHLSEPSDKYY